MFRRIYISMFLTFFSVTITDMIWAAEEEPIDGAEVISLNCARCHNTRTIDEFTIQEWAVIMPHMRERAHLTGEESRAVLRFFQTIKQSSEEHSSSNGNALRTGEQLVSAYGCVACHSYAGNGGKAVSLDNVITRLGEDFFRRKLQNPQFNNSATPMPKMNISEEEIDQLIIFFRDI
tara:strand:+ start:6984 stop:7514 length:531 start_codon:yes stop_codon:yes gene_type:complete